jgi:NADH-quinone oxidoreductase subunit M
MILLVLLFLPLLGGLLAWLAGRWNNRLPRWISLGVLVANLALAVAVWSQRLRAIHLAIPATGAWLYEFNWPWIPQFGIRFHLGLDGLSLVLLLLTNLLGIFAVAASWSAIDEHVGFYHFNLLWILSALVGVFLVIDMFLFYFFWELMLVPLYFLIGIWGHANRVYATLKFFLFTQVSGLLMLLSILGLFFVHGSATGVYTFDYQQLLGTPLSPRLATWLMLGFFAAFAVKLPVVPFHTWLPDAHTEAPTAGSVVLAGLVVKAGAYGFLRFMFPLFPRASLQLAPLGMALAVIGILYGAILAFAQTDLKRLVAYTSISHMGFVLLGIFAWKTLALQGAVMIIIAHGLSTGGLFILVGSLSDRLHTRDLDRMGGLWGAVPRMGRVGLVLALASLGLPGLVNFVGEFLVLLGAYRVSHVYALLAALGFIVAAIYALWMVQRIFAGEYIKGPAPSPLRIPDFNSRELAVMTLIIVIIFWLGVYPQPVLSTTQPSIDTLQQDALILHSADLPQLQPLPSLPALGGQPVDPAIGKQVNP